MNHYKSGSDDQFKTNIHTSNTNSSCKNAEEWRIIQAKDPKEQLFINQFK